MNCYYTKKLLNYGFLEQMKDIYPILINSIIMLVMIIIANTLFDSYWMQIGVGALIGVLSYYIVSIMYKEPALDEFLSIVKSKIGRKN